MVPLHGLTTYWLLNITKYSRNALWLQSGAAPWVVLFLLHLIAEPFYAKTRPLISLVSPCCHRQMLVSFPSVFKTVTWFSSTIITDTMRFSCIKVDLCIWNVMCLSPFALLSVLQLKLSLSGLVRAASGCIWGLLPTLVLLGVTRYSGLILYISCPATWPRRLGTENKNNNSSTWTHPRPAKCESLGSGADTVCFLSAPGRGGQPLG